MWPTMRATPRPARGRLCAVVVAAVPVGVAMMAWRPTSSKAMACAVAGRRWRGNRQVHALGVGDGPLQRLHAAHGAAHHGQQRVDAQVVEQRAWAWTMSPMVMMGKSVAVGPAGGGVDGGRPGGARQPPMTLAHITKYLSVSKALPGPTMMSHQPAARPLALWRAGHVRVAGEGVQTSTALSRAALSVP